VFGKNVAGGVLRNKPQITPAVTVNDDSPFQYVFPNMYATLPAVWHVWMQRNCKLVTLKKLQRLALVNASSFNITPMVNARSMLISNYPNPFTAKTKLNTQQQVGLTLVQLISAVGSVVKNLVDVNYSSRDTYTGCRRKLRGKRCLLPRVAEFNGAECTSCTENKVVLWPHYNRF
jgi:hypothetical protein